MLAAVAPPAAAVVAAVDSAVTVVVDEEVAAASVAAVAVGDLAVTAVDEVVAVGLGAETEAVVEVCTCGLRESLGLTLLEFEQHLGYSHLQCMIDAYRIVLIRVRRIDLAGCLWVSPPAAPYASGRRPPTGGNYWCMTLRERLRQMPPGCRPLPFRGWDASRYPA